MTITVGSLFSGIGGFDLGLERAGMKVVWQSEINPYACKVMEKHWPDVPNLGDITKITEAPQVDWICGGFPCQDISNAGKRAGITGSRSGLWGEMVRTVRLVRPLHVLVENVAALLARGMGRVLGDLAESGYDSEWDCLPACSVGAPHIRDRVFICSNARSKPFCGWEVFAKDRRIANEWEKEAEKWGSNWIKSPVGPASLCRVQGGWTGFDSKSEISRMVDGVPDGLDQLECLGNAVVPQVAEWIGRRIIESAEAEA